MSKEARIRSRQMREAQALAARRRRNRKRLVVGTGGLVIVSLLVAIVAVVVASAKNGSSSGDANSRGNMVAPATATSNGAIAVGDDSAPVKVEVYLDYMCPYCGRFEQTNSGELDRLIEAGKVKLELHPLSFLDRASDGARYSTRAANAIATVADRAPTSVLAFNNALFAQQPAEGTRGPSDTEIATLAIRAGVPQEVVDAFTDRIFEPWVATSTDDAFSAGITGTPTVKINGKVFKGDLYAVGPLTAAIEAAGAGGD